MQSPLINNKKVLPHRVLAIDPTRLGFGYVVLEGSQLLDFGLRLRGKTPATDSVARSVELMEQYHPHFLVIEDTDAKGCWRRERARNFLTQLAKAAVIHHCKIARVSRKAEYAFFSQHGFTSKRKIAEAVAEFFPSLASRMPPPRKPWKREDERMGIFDAAAFAITFLSKE
jgi:hypothetical protein